MPYYDDPELRRRLRVRRAMWEVWAVLTTLLAFAVLVLAHRLGR